ncbi:MAG: radical SAM protein [Candidatus Alcyoniella australis]|nr:radical SAM protein [Candidatus Alcyoniella australis]
MAMYSRRTVLKDLRQLFDHPRLLPKLAKVYARLALGRGPVLRGAEFAVTYRCPMNCAHCLKTGLVDAERKELRPDEIAGITGQMADLGAIFCNLTGGDPLERDDIEEIVTRCAARRDILITIGTSGWQLTPQRMAALVRAGLDMITFSLDGASAQTHDRSRGCPGHFEQTIAAIQMAQAVDLPTWATTILTAENTASGEIFAVAELARKLGVTLTVNWAYPAGEWAGDELLPDELEVEAFRTLQRMPHVRWEGTSNWFGEGCPAGSEKIYITPYGDVFACSVIQATFGNLRNEPLSTIHRRMIEVPIFDGRCKDCLTARDPDFVKGVLREINSNPGKPYKPWTGDEV